MCSMFIKTDHNHIDFMWVWMSCLHFWIWFSGWDGVPSIMIYCFDLASSLNFIPPSIIIPWWKDRASEKRDKFRQPTVVYSSLKLIFSKCGVSLKVCRGIRKAIRTRLQLYFTVCKTCCSDVQAVLHSSLLYKISSNWSISYKTQTVHGCITGTHYHAVLQPACSSSFLRIKKIFGVM